MAALVLKNVPRRLHQQLKEEAARNRRSMTQQALLMLEESLRRASHPTRLDAAQFPAPLELVDRSTGRKVLMTQPMLRRAIRQGRA